MKKVYCTTKTGGQSVIEPSIIDQPTPCVYGAENFEIALLRAVEGNGDLDGEFGFYQTQAYFNEMYINSFQKRYSGQSCYLCEVEPDTFVNNPHAWPPEVISEKPVKILNETFIPDIYKFFINLQQKSKFKLNTFNSHPQYMAMVNRRLDTLANFFNIKNDPAQKAIWQKLFPDYMQNFGKEKPPVYYQGRVYHASTHSGQTELIPRSSTHGTPYVYGAKSFELALTFGAQGNRDLDGPHAFSHGIPVMYEAFAGAFQKRFDGKSCSVYELDPTNFMEGKTSWSAEIVSEKPVKVLSETKIKNLYNILLKLNAEGKVELHFYSEEKDYQAFINQYIEKLERNYRPDLDEKMDRFWQEHYPHYERKLPSKKSTQTRKHPAKNR